MVLYNGVPLACSSLRSNPSQFVQELATASTPVARKWALAKARPRIEPELKKQGLAWEDVLPILETIDTVEEIQQAIDDPEAFMRKLATASGPAARKVALAKSP